jgi:hypothetical protein
MFSKYEVYMNENMGALKDVVHFSIFRKFGNDITLFFWCIYLIELGGA